MSVPSSNVTVTCESPNFEIDRTSSSPGRPEIACSTRVVIWRSVSSGESDAATVLTWTMMSGTSGKASIDRRETAIRPVGTSRNASASTTRR